MFDPTGVSSPLPLSLEPQPDRMSHRDRGQIQFCWKHYGHEKGKITLRSSNVCDVSYSTMFRIYTVWNPVQHWIPLTIVRVGSCLAVASGFIIDLSSTTHKEHIWPPCLSQQCGRNFWEYKIQNDIFQVDAILNKLVG